MTFFFQCRCSTCSVFFFFSIRFFVSTTQWCFFPCDVFKQSAFEKIFFFAKSTITKELNLVGFVKWMVSIFKIMCFFSLLTLASKFLRNNQNSFRLTINFLREKLAVRWCHSMTLESELIERKLCKYTKIVWSSPFLQTCRSTGNFFLFQSGVFDLTCLVYIRCRPTTHDDGVASDFMASIGMSRRFA